MSIKLIYPAAAAGIMRVMIPCSWHYDYWACTQTPKNKSTSRVCPTRSSNRFTSMSYVNGENGEHA